MPTSRMSNIGRLLVDKYPRHVAVLDAKLLLRRDVNRAKKIVAAVEREQLTQAYAEVTNRRMKREQPCD